MTILNVHLDENHALVAVNTEGVCVDGRKSINASKIFVLPHAHAVLAFGGPIAVGQRVFFDCCASLRGLDDLFQTFDSYFENRCAEFQKEVAAAGVTVLQNAMCVLVGWSPRWNQVVGMHCTRFDTSSTQVAQNSLSPVDDSWPALPRGWPTNAEEMIETARFQAHHAALKWPEHAWGGDLVMAEVTREEITFRTVRDFSAA